MAVRQARLVVSMRRTAYPAKSFGTSVAEPTSRPSSHSEPRSARPRPSANGLTGGYSNGLPGFSTLSSPRIRSSTPHPESFTTPRTPGRRDGAGQQRHADVPTRRLQHTSYPPGSWFIDPGRGNVHLARNDGAEATIFFATYTDLPGAAARRASMPPHRPAPRHRPPPPRRPPLRRRAPSRIRRVRAPSQAKWSDSSPVRCSLCWPWLRAARICARNEVARRASSHGVRHLRASGNYQRLAR